MITELVSRAAVYLIIWIVALRWLEYPPPSPARPRIKPLMRPIARQWSVMGQLGPRLIGVRLQLVVL